MRRSIALLTTLAPLTAFAGNDSIVTFGIGSHAVVSRAAGRSSEAGSATGVGQGFSARLRLLYVLGAEFTYEWTSLRSRTDLNVAVPTYQWSGLVYLVPHSRFSLFLLGGFGATNASDLLSPSGGTTSYHGGVGLEVGITRNWVVSADFRVNLPAYSQAFERGKQDAFDKRTVPSIGDYYNLDSWQLNAGVRYYF